MQNLIQSSRNRLTILTGALIVAAFLSKVLKLSSLTSPLLLAASIAGAIPIAVQAYQALRLKVISIELLVTIAILGAFAIQEYEESAIVAFLFLFGAWLEQKTLNKTRSAIKELTEMAPENAHRQNSDGTYEEIATDKVQPGDILLVKTGDKIPVDGEVTAGNGSAAEAAITGEAMPAKKTVGDSVYAGTILQNGTIHIQARKVGEDTTFGKILELIEEAQDTASPAERFIDRFARYYTPAVLTIAVITWLVTHNLSLAITILVLGCPGALVIGVPVSSVSGIGRAARNGILFKGSNVISTFAHVDTVFFDKTGTLTYGHPKVTAARYYTKDPSLAKQILVSVEQQSAHPLAQAILDAFPDQKTLPVQAMDAVAGKGIVATVAQHTVLLGSRALLQQYGIGIQEQLEQDLKAMEGDGDSIAILVIDQTPAMIVGIRDSLRPTALQDLKMLRKLDVKNLILLSGDTQASVDRIARQLPLSEAYGNLLPQQKAELVQQRKQAGETVAFVGDGINDSPSLALADIGIAMGNGTDVAIETSDIVLLNSDLHHLSIALAIARAAHRNMIENIVIALATVAFLLASLIGGSWMNMAIGMFVHEASILVVILNAMRLLRFRNRNIS